MSRIVKAEIELGLDSACTRAQELAAFKQPGSQLAISREQVDAMIQILKKSGIANFEQGG
jgi:hypothetical protein